MELTSILNTDAVFIQLHKLHINLLLLIGSHHAVVVDGHDGGGGGGPRIFSFSYGDREG